MCNSRSQMRYLLKDLEKYPQNPFVYLHWSLVSDLPACLEVCLLKPVYLPADTGATRGSYVKIFGCVAVYFRGIILNSNLI